VQARHEANVLRCAGDDPLVAIWEVGEGKRVRLHSDCGPQGASRSYADHPNMRACGKARTLGRRRRECIQRFWLLAIADWGAVVPQ